MQKNLNKNIFFSILVACLLAISGYATSAIAASPKTDADTSKGGKCVIDNVELVLTVVTDIKGGIFAYGSSDDNTKNSKLYEVKGCKYLLGGRGVFKFIDDIHNSYAATGSFSCDQLDAKSEKGCRMLTSVGGVPTTIEIQVDQKKWTILFSESSTTDREIRKLLNKFAQIFDPVNLHEKILPIDDQDLLAVSNLKMAENPEFKEIVKKPILKYDGGFNQIAFMHANMDALLQTFAAFERNKFSHNLSKEVSVIKKYADDNSPKNFKRLTEFSKKENRFSLSDQLIENELRREFESNVLNAGDLEIFGLKISELDLFEIIKRQPIRAYPIKERMTYGIRIAWNKKSFDLKNTPQCKELRTSTQTSDTGYLERVLTSSSRKTETFKFSKCTGDASSFKKIEFTLIGNTDASNQLQSSWEVSEVIATSYSRDIVSSPTSTSTSTPSSSTTGQWAVVSRKKVAAVSWNAEITIQCTSGRNRGETYTVLALDSGRFESVTGPKEDSLEKVAKFHCD
jgi:hypothetical protein